MNRILPVILLLSLLGLSSQVLAAAQTIEAAVGDQEFVINGVQYSAKSACYGFQMGDQVEFMEGNDNGNCTETVIYNLRNNEACDAWCQYPL